MKQNKKGKSGFNLSSIIITLFVFSILFTIAVSAGATSAFAYENYQLTAPFSPVTVASCAAQTEILSLRNAGDEAAQLTLTFVDKNVAKFAQIVPSQLFLAPGEAKTLTIFVNAPCDTQGNFDYAINLRGNSISQIFDRQIAVNKISNVDFIATKGNVLNSCPCIPQTIPFTITNTGSWAESYEVSAIGQEEHVAVPQGQIFLAPGQTFSGAAFVSYSCQTYGVKDFKLQVESTNSKFKATMPITYNIAACYDYNLGIDKNVSVCEQDTIQAVAVINNTASYTNTFDIRSKLPIFAEQLGNQVTLGAQQVGLAPIDFTPSKGDSGSYTYTVSTVSKLGKLTATQTGIINVDRCYEYNIATANDVSNFAVCAPGEKLSFTITNNGQRSQEMNVNSSDARFTSTPNIFNLSAGASKTIILSVPAANIEAKTSFNVQVWSTNNPNVVAAKQITIVPKDLQTCFGVEVSPETFIVNNSVQNLAIKVNNVGIRDTVYNVTIAGPQWAKLLNNTVYIAARSSEYLTLQSNAPVFVDNGTFVTNLSFETTYTQQIESVTLILNPQSAKWLLWFMLIILLLLVALLVILLVARRSRSRQSMGQPATHTSVQDAQKVTETKTVAAPVAPKVRKLTAAQKRALRNERRRNKKNSSESSWGRLLFIILIVAILLALLLSLIVKDSNQNNPNSAAANSTTVNNTANVSNNSISGSSGSQPQINTTYVTNVTPTKNITSNITIVPNITANVSQNETQSSSFWQDLVDFFGSFKIFQSPSSNLSNTTLPNVTIASNITNISNTSNTTITNIIITPNISSVNVSNLSASNQSNSTNQSNATQPVYDEKKAQRDRELAAAYATIADSQAMKYTRVFVLVQNTSGKLNLSQYFIDLDNLSLSFEFQSVNASKMTAFINNDLLFLEPNTNFVGVQTFRIIATNQANLSTISPLFTVAVIDELPRAPISQSIQLGLLILLIVIALIVYFDIRLISKQYEHARSIQNDKKRK